LLATALSKALVAFTLEWDNEFEHRLPHRTTNFGGTRGAPWLISMAMWFNCLKYVGLEGISARDLEKLARTHTNLRGMQRWGYIVADPLIRAKPAGLRAKEICGPLFAVIESRWPTATQLREALDAVVRQIDLDLPDCMPILGYGLASHSGPPKKLSAPLDPGLPLPALLARALNAFTIEYESESGVSLASGANFLRVLNATGVPVRELPHLAGVAKEQVAIALGFLQKRSLVKIEPGKVKTAALTPKGLESQERYWKLVAEIEDRWSNRFRSEAIGNLRAQLAKLPNVPPTPYPGGWRAKVPPPGTLPHYPLVTHRGGFPDGS
jgi:hypothetical protein